MLVIFLLNSYTVSDVDVTYNPGIIPCIIAFILPFIIIYEHENENCKCSNYDKHTLDGCYMKYLFIYSYILLFYELKYIF